MGNLVSTSMSATLEALYVSVPAPTPLPHRPSVTLSYAQSLDGSIAATAGHSLLLSGQESMSMTHQLRAKHAGILVGIGTVLADNPRLTTRLAGGSHPRPIVVDTHLRTPLESNILKHPHPVTIAYAVGARQDRKTALLKAGAELIPIPQGEGGNLDLEAMLLALKSGGVQSLMVEGGAKVITSFLAHKLVDMFVLTISPRLVGGLHAPAELLKAQAKIRAPRWVQLGEDQIVWGSLEWQRR